MQPGWKFWQSVALTRVILSRELSLDEVAEIRQASPDMQIEVFVHGACASPTGRCPLSGYFNHRDANQGPAPTRAAGTTRSREDHRCGGPRSLSADPAPPEGRRGVLPGRTRAPGRVHADRDEHGTTS